MNENLESIISHLDDMAEWNPDFRSRKTGYTFSELSLLYQDLDLIQYAKYYGNVRAGNLAKDREMVIKSYQKKVKDLKQEYDVNEEISENYKSEIKSFYDSYKAAGLYRQAKEVQTQTVETNRRDQYVIEDRDLEDYKNTYDGIILSYADHACATTDAKHTIEYYNNIISAYANDEVPQEVKDELIEKNEKILQEIATLSAAYSELANQTIDELYAGKVNEDLQYLIQPEVTTDIPVKLIAAFLVIVTFGLGMIAVFVYEILKKHIDFKKLMEKTDEGKNEKIEIDTTDMDDVHKALYQQYLNGFNEFFLVYQTMFAASPDKPQHCESFIRWRSPELGMISPGKIINCLSDFGIFRQFNDWIIQNVCDDLAALNEKGKPLPVVHINCPYSEVNDCALNDIIIEHLARTHVPAENLCLELEGKEITNSLADIMLLNEMNINICIDRFDNSSEENEIISVVQPKYVKVSLDIFNADIYATSDEDINDAKEQAAEYLSTIVEKCHGNNIEVCVCGVEKESQDKVITELGVDYKQGYFYAKPEKLQK